jgi:hypothetical protein
VQDDHTLHAVKSALGMAINQLPERVSGVAIELWRDVQTGEQSVKVIISTFLCAMNFPMSDTVDRR